MKCIGLYVKIFEKVNTVKQHFACNFILLISPGLQTKLLPTKINYMVKHSKLIQIGEIELPERSEDFPMP